MGITTILACIVMRLKKGFEKRRLSLEVRNPVNINCFHHCDYHRHHHHWNFPKRFVNGSSCMGVKIDFFPPFFFSSSSPGKLVTILVS